MPAPAPFAPTEREAIELLRGLVALAPTNLEDPLHDRYEKPNYPRAAERLARMARDAGLATRIFDPVIEGPPNPHLRNIPRPSVIADLDVGATERVLLLAHYDVVPVPAEQLDRWKSPPHILTKRDDGRLYGRGSNDDLGSGVVTGLLALKKISEGDGARRNVRFILCCDEETGGEGGIESMKAHDDRLSAGDPGRILQGDVALLPDGSPHATAGSSGLVFVDTRLDRPVPVRSVVETGRVLIRLDSLAKAWRSTLPSPDWPNHGAPEPVITGRATLTKFDAATAETGAADRLRLRAARSETDAPNQIAAAVTLVFEGPAPDRDRLLDRASGLVPAPYRVAPAAGTSLDVPPGTTAIQVVGLSSHGGYPHRGHNPVPPALDLLERAAEAGWLDGAARLTATFSVDLRLTPEMPMEAGRTPALIRARESLATAHLPAEVDAPEERCRGGYALAPDHPQVVRLARLLAEEGGDSGVFGEYGGTDASSLIGLTTSTGAPLPALVFGSMDRDAHIHEAEESVDPRLLLAIARTVYRFVQEP
jgi:acetylornithine deacetylase/succinyl-diaminopimelate desuccinylase-like protein